jgi:copper chaperone CopZ
MRNLTLTVVGMKCGGCASSVRAALEDVDGVTEVEVALEAGTARIVADDAVERSSLISAVERAGYEAV